MNREKINEKLMEVADRRNRLSDELTQLENELQGRLHIIEKFEDLIQSERARAESLERRVEGKREELREIAYLTAFLRNCEVESEATDAPV